MGYILDLKMKCGVHNVETPPYPEDEEVQGFHDILKEYKPAYDTTLRESEALKKMPRICNFIEDEWYCKKTAYLVEYKLRDREGCPLCPRDLHGSNWEANNSRNIIFP